MQVFLVYDWYADADDDSNYIDRSSDVIAVYDTLEKAENSIKGRPRVFGGLYSSWNTIEVFNVK